MIRSVTQLTIAGIISQSSHQKGDLANLREINRRITETASCSPSDQGLVEGEGSPTCWGIVATEGKERRRERRGAKLAS